MERLSSYQQFIVIVELWACLRATCAVRSKERDRPCRSRIPRRAVRHDSAHCVCCRNRRSFARVNIIMSKVFDTALLIAEVRKRPGLYDKNLDVDRDEKLALWKDIGAAVYRDWSSITKAVAYDRGEFVENR